MLLANISVAQKIYDEFSECALLRKHPPPPPSNYDILIKAAKSKVSECSSYYVSSLYNPKKVRLPKSWQSYTPILLQLSCY